MASWITLSRDVCLWQVQWRGLSPPGLGWACVGVEEELSPVLIFCRSEHRGPTGRGIGKGVISPEEVLSQPGVTQLLTHSGGHHTSSWPRVYTFR